MEYKNKEKTEGTKNSSRLTEPKNGLTVTKGKRTGEGEWEGRDKGENGTLRLAHNVAVGGTWGKQYIQRRQVMILQHLAKLMDSDCNGLCGGDLKMGAV